MQPQLNNIIGPDALVFGVEDVESCHQYLTDYGLKRTDGGRFEAVDGTYIEIASKDDPTLPPAMPATNTLRKTIYGVESVADVAAIAENLRRDREVRELADGSIETVDDSGFTIGFQVTKRRPFSLPAERVNAPGDVRQRALGVPGVPATGDVDPLPRSLSHVVYYVPDAEKAEAFYVRRLGFGVTDRMVSKLGPSTFLRPPGMLEHHTMFIMQAPKHMAGCEHFTFHMAGPTEVLSAGHRLVEKGYTSFWGPGRHRFASNWFWYFNSPLGCHVEYDADMDQFDWDWQPRTLTMDSESAQSFLLGHRKKWSPGDGPPGPGQHG